MGHKSFLTWQEHVAYRALKLASKSRAKLYRKKKLVHNNIVPKLSERGELRAGPITVIGLFSAALGLGVAARNLVTALREISDEVYTIDITFIHPGLKKTVEWTDRKLPNRTAGGTRIYCVNPPDVLRLLAATDASELLHTRLIGYWWWELEIIPPSWIDICELFDEIWSSSHFIKSAFERSVVGPKKTYIPPYVRIPDVGCDGRRSRHPLVRDGEFTVLCAFDLHSWTSRKNPMGAIEAFRSAFGDSYDKHLIVKVLNGQQNPNEFKRLVDAASDLRNVTFLTDTLSSLDFSSLIASSSVYISLHRSEGLGLVLIEAMLLRTPVIATGWSGPADFLTAENSGQVSYFLRDVELDEYAENVSGSRWAEPSLKDAAKWLLLLQENPDLRQKLSEAAFKTADSLFGSGSTRIELASALERASVRVFPASPPRSDVNG